MVWNYKYADVEFGRLQARDLLQHLWTGPISNAPVDIVQVRCAAWWSCRVHIISSHQWQDRAGSLTAYDMFASTCSEMVCIAYMCPQSESSCSDAH